LAKANFCPIGDFFKPYPSRAKAGFKKLPNTSYFLVVFLKKMLTKSSPISTQSNLFHSELFSQLDVKDPLIQLVNKG
jgi:hypothetical protein